MLTNSNGKSPPAIGANHAGSQRIVNVRKILGEGLACPDELSLTPEDVRLILHLRAIGYGELRISVLQGRPAKCVRAEESIDYTKPIAFE